MLKLRFLGDNVLREHAVPVTDITPEIKSYLDQMVDLMDHEHGVGLAAPQVGLNYRMLVMLDQTDDKNAKIIKMINPKKVLVSSECIEMEEGCLSVQGTEGPVYADVTRPEEITVSWMDEFGKSHSKKFVGMPARIVQHEMDHLDGILFIDYLSSAKRTMITNKVKKREVMAKKKGVMA